MREALRDWRFPAALAALLFGVAFALSSVNGSVGLRDARRQVAEFQEQASCRSELAAGVTAARSDVEAIDGQMIATMARTFADALSGPLSDERRQQLQGIYRDQLTARESLQTVLDEQIARQEQSPELCPG